MLWTQLHEQYLHYMKNCYCMKTCKPTSSQYSDKVSHLFQVLLSPMPDRRPAAKQLLRCSTVMVWGVVKTRKRKSCKYVLFDILSIRRHPQGKVMICLCFVISHLYFGGHFRLKTPIVRPDFQN